MEALPDEIAKDWMPLSEVIEILKVKKSKVYQLKRQRVLRHKKYMNRAMFSRASVAAFLGRYRDG